MSQNAHVVRRWAWLIILCPIVAALIAGVVTLRLPNVYEAHVLVLVRPVLVLVRPDQVLSICAQCPAPTRDQILRTYAALMTQPPLLKQVISDEGLHTDPASLSKQITVTLVPNTSILDVAVHDTNPTRARDIANRLVSDFIAEVTGFQRQETSLPNARTGDNLLVVSPAVLPDRPVSPKPLWNIGVGLLAGLLIGLGLAFLLDHRHPSART